VAQVTHVANPYVGANGYVNPDYATEISEAIATAPAGSTLASQMSVVATYPTAVWMDHIGAITATTGAHRGLAAHITAALAQQAASGSSAPVVVEIVIYDLPDRDCAALASNGELSIAGNDTVNINGVATQLTGTGLTEYETDYINPIFNILQAEATNPNIRFSLVVEDDSLPNLITNTGIGGAAPIANCVAANNGQTFSQGISMNGVYVQGIAYAINKFHQLPNAYTYLDVGHHGWLGWPANMAAAVTFFKQFVTTQLTDSYASLDGFITNTANYGTVKEPFLTFNQEVDGAQVYQSTCTSTWCGFQFDPNIDEQDYALNFAAALSTPTSSSYTFVDGSTVAGGGFPSGLGFLIDTSRDGWGSPLRPTGPSTSTVLDTFVQDSLIDLRDDMGQWCNQTNAGLGVPPTATPSPGILAYVWIKPPGESDGNYPGSIYAGTNDGALDGVASTVGDPNCNPAHANALANSQTTNAMANSPSAGTFWAAEFTGYVQNAFPPIPVGNGFSVSATSVSTVQGTTATTGVTVSEFGTFSGTVALSISTLPTGVTAAFSPTSVTGSAGSTLTFTVSGTTTPGTYPLTVTGTSGTTTETATLNLTVVSKPTFTIIPSSTSVTVAVGTNPTDSFAIAFQGGLTGSVSVSATGAPNGMQINFAPNSVNAPGGTIVANFSVQSSTPAGSYPINIVGTNGTITNSVPITVIVPGTGFTLAPSATSLSVKQGSSGTDTITVTDLGGFTGTVSFTASGLPSGVTASFSPASSTTSSVLTLTASSAATLGAFTVTVSGTSGSTTATTSLTLNVTSAIGFTLAASPATLSITQGNTATDTVTVTDLGGFTGSVTFAATGLPSGVTASFSPASSATSSVLTLTASSTATLGGPVTVTITGTSGSTTATTTIALTVNPSSGFTLAPSPATLPITQGKTATDTITVTDLGGFTGSVTFTATGLPSGVTASFSPASSTTSSVLTLTATTTATLGAATITVTGTSGSTTATTTIALTVGQGGGGACTVDYTISPQNTSQFGATITIVNGGTTALSNWSLTWTFANGQTISNSWNGAVTQSGGNVTVSQQAGQTWQNIPAGGSYSGFGFNGTWNGTANAIPTAFSLNGTACTVN
jgi:cellulase/cellobiase CelA1